MPEVESLLNLNIERSNSKNKTNLFNNKALRNICSSNNTPVPKKVVDITFNFSKLKAKESKVTNNSRNSYIFNE